MIATGLILKVEATVPQVGTLVYASTPFDQTQELSLNVKGTLASSRDIARKIVRRTPLGFYIQSFKEFYA